MTGPNPGPDFCPQKSLLLLRDTTAKWNKDLQDSQSSFHPKSLSLDPDLLIPVDIFSEYRILLAFSNFPFPEAKKSENALVRKTVTRLHWSNVDCAGWISGKQPKKLDRGCSRGMTLLGPRWPQGGSECLMHLLMGTLTNPIPPHTHTPSISWP
jgi:hypothetical protein